MVKNHVTDLTHDQHENQNAALTGLESPPPSKLPREVTTKASAHSWREPRVRFWWTATIVLLLIALYVIVTQAWVWSREKRLLVSGILVEAHVVEANGQYNIGKKQPPDSRVKLKATVNGRERRYDGFLAGRKQHIVVGEKVPIRVDPENPGVWTARTEPAPLAKQLVGAWVPAPVIVIALLASLLARRGVLSTWQTGPSAAAVVVGTSHSALAPLSRVVRCALSDGSDKRLFTVFVPNRVARLQPGDALWLVLAPNRPDRALAAMLYE